jgi:hypothetical protein
MPSLGCDDAQLPQYARVVHYRRRVRAEQLVPLVAEAFVERPASNIGDH